MPASVTTAQPGLALEASPANLHDLVVRAARTSPQRVAVGTADGTLELSYRELDVVRLARLGVGPGDTIALRCDNSMEFVLTLLAVASRGDKFSPQQIDAVLLSNAKVQDALSFGVPDEKYGEEINAAVIPKRIFFVTKLPLTAKKAGDRRKSAVRSGSFRGS